MKGCLSLCFLNLKRRAGLAVSLAVLYFLSCFFVVGCFLFSVSGRAGARAMLDADPTIHYVGAAYVGADNAGMGYPVLTDDADLSALAAEAASVPGVTEATLYGEIAFMGGMSLSPPGQEVAMQYNSFSCAFGAEGALSRTYLDHYAGQGKEALLAGRAIDAEADGAEVVVSASFAKNFGFDRPEDLLGYTLRAPLSYTAVFVPGEDGLTESIEWEATPFLPEAEIVGIVRDDLGGMFFGETSFVFARAQDIQAKKSALYQLRAYCSYGDKEAVAQRLNEAEPQGSFTPSSVPYSVRRFGEIVDFFSAVLALVFILFLAAAVLANVSASAFLYQKKRAFCRAAFACGYARGALALTEFLQSAVLALAAAVFALPLAHFAVLGCVSIMSLLGYGAFAAAFHPAAVPVAGAVQLASAGRSALALRIKYAKDGF